MKEDYRGIPADWRKSWHYQNGVSCQDCHGGDPKDAARSMQPESGFVGVPKPKMVPEFCGKCHLGIKENYLESGHGKALMTTGGVPTASPATIPMIFRKPISILSTKNYAASATVMTGPGR